MSFVQGRIRNDAARTIMVCVDTYEENILNGRLYHYGQEDEGHEFHSLMQLLMKTEELLDASNFPQAFTMVRSFGPIGETHETISTEECSRGKLATFVIKVLFRQHTSWQGSVTWLEAQSEQPFRSVLELAMLMNSALVPAV